MNGMTLLGTVAIPPVLPGDVGTARVRLPLAAFSATGLLPGDTVLVTPAGTAATDGAAADGAATAATTTIAIAWPLPPDAARLSPPPLPRATTAAAAAPATTSAAMPPLVGVPLDRTLWVPPSLHPPPLQPSRTVVARGTPPAPAGTVIPALTVVPLVPRRIPRAGGSGRDRGGGGAATARHAVATLVASHGGTTGATAGATAADGGGGRGGVVVPASASDAAARLEDLLTSPALVGRPLPAHVRVALPREGGPDGAPTIIWDVVLSAALAPGGGGGGSNGSGSGGGSSGVRAVTGVMATDLSTRLTLCPPPLLPPLPPSLPPPSPLPLAAMSPRGEAAAANPPPPCSAAALALLTSLLTADVGAAVAEAGAPPPAGVLLAGPPGVGKTSAVEAAAAATGVPLFVFHAAQMERGGGGKAGERGWGGDLAAAFARARATADGRAAVAAAAAVAATERGREGSYCRPLPASSAVLLLVDEVDAICGGQSLGGSAGSGSGGSAGGSADGGSCSDAAALAALLDAAGGCPRAGGGYLLVVAATNRPAALPHYLRRRGRLDRELRLAPPDRAERAAIVSALAAVEGGSQGMGGTTAANVAARVADATPGFVGADLALLADRARRAAADRRARRAARRAARGECLGTHAAAAIASAPCGPLRWADWASALRHVGASTLRGPLDATPPGPPDDSAWAAIGGAAAVKARLAAAVGWPATAGGRIGGGGPPATTTAALALRGRGTPRGVLLYGPPGTGKTALVRAAAAAGAVAFLRLDPAAAYSAYLGEAEATVRAAFATARAAAPAVLFLDELDALVGSRDASVEGGGDGSGAGGGGVGGGSGGADSGGGSGVRRRVLATLLTEMDGISGAPGVVVVGATNRPDLLDAALLRPGRFDDLLPVPPPATDADRVSVLAAVVAAGRGIPLGGGVDLGRVATATTGRSGAELAALVREAAMAAVREEVATAAAATAGSVGGGCVEQRHFDAAVAAAVPLPSRVAAVGTREEARGAPTP